MNDSWNRAALERWIMTDSRWKINNHSRLSPDTLLILWPRSLEKWYAESFIEPKVSMAIGRKVFAEGMSAYFWHFLACSSEFGHLSTFTSCGSDIRVCQGAHNCDVPYQQLLEFVSSHPDVYHLDVLGRLVPSLQARSPTPGLEPSDRSVAILIGACLRLRAYRERQQPIPAVRS